MLGFWHNGLVPASVRKAISSPITFGLGEESNKKQHWILSSRKWEKGKEPSV